MELTEVFEVQFARMPVLNMVWAALLDGALAVPSWPLRAADGRHGPRSVFVALAMLGLAASLILPITSDASVAAKVVLA